MEFSELVNARRSCRHYTAEPVSGEEIEALLEKANLSASACNSQPWHFTVLLSPEKRALGAEAVYVFPPTNAFAREAAALLVLSAEREPEVMPGVKKTLGSSYFSDIDIGSAAAYFTLAAADAGLATCIMGVFDEKKLREAAALGADLVPRLVIALGHAADGDRPHTKKRKAAAEKTVIL